MFKQKIKHLLFEHKVSVDGLRSENTASLLLAAEQKRVGDLELRRDKASLKDRLHHQQLQHEEMVKTIKKVRITRQFIFFNFAIACCFILLRHQPAAY